MVRELTIEHVDGAARESRKDRVVIEEPLQLRACGVAVATIMRTPGHDLELARGLLHAEGIAGAIAQVDADAIAPRFSRCTVDVLDLDLAHHMPALHTARKESRLADER